MNYPLEPKGAEIRALADAATRFIEELIEGLDSAPAAPLQGAKLEAERVRRDEAPQEGGATIEDALEVVGRAAHHAINTAGPGFMGYIPGGGLYAGALGDYLTGAVNRYSGYWVPAPVFAELEWSLIRWFCDLFDFPDTARGSLTSGGSMANFSAVVTARSEKLPGSYDFSSTRLYVSRQAHHSLPKAAKLAGLPPDAVRDVDVDRQLRMDPDALREAVKEDLAAGFRPFMVAATAGTTNTGAVDPLPEIESICREHDLWFHVDAAYGAFFQLTQRGREAFRGIASADSITLDPHKGMFLAYGTGCLIARDGTALRRAHTSPSVSSYLMDLGAEEDSRDFAEYSAEMSRHMRTLRVWLPLKLHGVAAFRAALDEKLDLASHVHDSLASEPGFELPWPPQLSVSAFRYLPAGANANDFNQNLLAKINDSGRVFISPTEIDRKMYLRAAILCHRTHRDRVDELIEITRKAAVALSDNV